MFNKILVPLDGSTLSEQALDPALVLAQHVQGEVVLMRVPMYVESRAEISPAYDFMWPEQQVAPRHEESAEYLAMLQEVRARPGLTIHTLVVDGDRAGAIVDTAVNENIDLIVMSTHSRSGLSRWVLGSVTERVLRHAPCPVLVVREPRQFSRILVTLDGSRLAEKALKPATALAAAHNSQLLLLSVVDDSVLDQTTQTELERGQSGAGEHIRSSLFQQTQNYLREIVNKYQQRGVRTYPAMASGAVPTAILDYVEEQDVDLIAMTTHGRTGLRRWVYGSVTEKVLRGTRCAMLIVRPPQEELQE